MLYKNLEGLPAQVKDNLPKHAQEIYLKLLTMHVNNIKNLKNVWEKNQERNGP